MIIYVISFLFLVLVGVLYISRLTRERDRVRRKAAAQKRIKDIQQAFRGSVKMLASQGMLNAYDRDRVYGIATNCFVFQPVTDENINYIDTLLKNFSAIITQELLSGDVTPEEFKKRMTVFTEQLPQENRGYNRGFYHERLPFLMELLKERIVSNDSEEREASSEAESAEEPVND